MTIKAEKGKSPVDPSWSVSFEPGNMTSDRPRTGGRKFDTLVLLSVISDTLAKPFLSQKERDICLGLIHEKDFDKFKNTFVDTNELTNDEKKVVDEFFKRKVMTSDLPKNTLENRHEIYEEVFDLARMADNYIVNDIFNYEKVNDLKFGLLRLRNHLTKKESCSFNRSFEEQATSVIKCLGKIGIFDGDSLKLLNSIPTRDFDKDSVLDNVVENLQVIQKSNWYKKEMTTTDKLAIDKAITLANGNINIEYIVKGD